MVCSWIYEKLTLFDKNFSVYKRMILKHLHVKPGESVLDFGCGTGYYSRLFEPSSYTGFDIDQKRIKWARKHHPKHRFYTMDGRKLPFKPRTFDHIAIVGVFHHIDDDGFEAAMENVMKLVKKRGDVVILEPTLSETSTNMNWWMKFFDRGKYIRYREQYEKRFYKYFKEVEARQFIDELLYNTYIYVLRKPR